MNMNMNICTGITHKDGKKEIRYCIDPVEDAEDIVTAKFIELSDDQIKEIENATVDKVQAILSNIF